MSRVFRAAGAAVVNAADVRGGLVLIAGGVHVLVTDYNLERETSAALVRSALEAHVPVVVLTSDPSGIERELRTRVVVLEKPAPWAAIESAILGLVDVVGSR
jgi:hypothetical protein